MSSVVISYSKMLTTIDSPDGEVVFDNPIRSENSAGRTIRLIKASFSSLIPNICNFNGVNNGLIRVTRDGGTNWTSIQLPDGVYEATHIESGINMAIADWWTDASDPGFQIRYNLASQLFYVAIDTTKIIAVDPATDQLGIDFSASFAYLLLGYDFATSTFIVDGLHGATNYARMNWFGDSVSLRLNGFGPLSVKNGRLSEELCSIPLSAASVQNEYVYPTSGIFSPIINADGAPSMLERFTVSFLGSRVGANGQQIPILILEGNVEVVFEFGY